MRLILASKSRGRKRVLELFGFDFAIEPANVDERSISNKSLKALTETIAEMKAEKIAKTCPNDTVVGVDTMLSKDGKFIGQAVDETEAIEILNCLLGEWHTVCSGYCVISCGKKVKGSAKSKLKLKRISEEALGKYIASGQWRGYAGAYNIIDPGFECFVEKVEGSKLNIVGLPAEKLLPIIEKLAGQKPEKSIKEIELELFNGKF